MKKLKQRWSKLPKLPRKWKIARNIAVALLLMPVVLSFFGWPALTSRMAYRMLEGRLLLSPSEVIYTHKTNNEAVFLTEGDSWVTAGNVTKVIVGNTPFRDNLACIHYVIPKDGLILIPLPGATEDNELVVAVSGLPKGTVSAEMELDLFEVPPLWYDNTRRADDETLTARTTAVKDGWMLFTFTPHDHGDGDCALTLMWRDMFAPWDSFKGYAYRLRFLDQQGTILERVSDTLPEGETYLDHN